MFEIIKKGTERHFDGCDFTLQLGEKRKGTEIKFLQLTDMQIIDSSQRRTPDRLSAGEIKAWAPENFDTQCGNHIRSLVAQTNPDLIFITGGIVYGSFDDNGTVFEWFCRLMDSFEIPWAPVFGNHDNETKKGVEWQCRRFSESKYCLFEKGMVSGNGNYCVGIATGDELVRVIHMIDSNGSVGSEDPQVIKEPGIYKDQLELIYRNTMQIKKSQNKNIPAFMAFHIPTEEFGEAEINSGYKTSDREFYTIGIDVAAKNNDFGFKYEKCNTLNTGIDFTDMLKKCNIDAVFAGHCHNICTSILYKDIRWVFGLKTGQYDYHMPGQLGGTLIRDRGSSFEINHIPALFSHGM